MYTQPPLTRERREHITNTLCNIISALVMDERNYGIDIGIQHGVTDGDPYSFVPVIKDDGSLTLTLRVKGAATNIDLGGVM